MRLDRFDQPRQAIGFPVVELANLVGLVDLPREHGRRLQDDRRKVVMEACTTRFFSDTPPSAIGCRSLSKAS
jgi:hypothetical protein